jgi:hypothetical protein
MDVPLLDEKTILESVGAVVDVCDNSGQDHLIKQIGRINAQLPGTVTEEQAAATVSKVALRRDERAAILKLSAIVVKKRAANVQNLPEFCLAVIVGNVGFRYWRATAHLERLVERAAKAAEKSKGDEKK